MTDHANITDTADLDDDVLTSPLGHRLMFLLFVCVAFCLFAPTILLPILKQHCELLSSEAQLHRQITGLEAETNRQDALHVAFAHDRTINERLAVLDLRYRHPDQEVLPVLSNGHATALPRPPPTPEFRSALTIPDDWPQGVHRIERWANDRGLIELFLDPSLRPAILLMSGGLIIAAMVLFAPNARRRQRQAAHHRSTLAADAAITHTAG